MPSFFSWWMIIFALATAISDAAYIALSANTWDNYRRTKKVIGGAPKLQIPAENKFLNALMIFVPRHYFSASLQLFLPIT